MVSDETLLELMNKYQGNSSAITEEIQNLWNGINIMSLYNDLALILAIHSTR